VFSENIVVLPLESAAAMACLHSRAHEVWARFFSNTLKDDLQYSPSSCFFNFPLPVRWDRDPALLDVGNAYAAHRMLLMKDNNEGLTKTYNRFHDPREDSPGVLRLRALHDAMDRAVLDAYAWTDLRPTCVFLLDYEDEHDESDDSGRPHARKQPWRYRWPDDLRYEVLSRMLALHQRRQ